MTYQNHAAEVLSKAIFAFRAGDFTLPSLAFRTEAILEQISPTLPDQAAREAMNCAYLIEEINAVALERGVAPSAQEFAEIERALKMIESLLQKHIPVNDESA